MSTRPSLNEANAWFTEPQDPTSMAEVVAAKKKPYERPELFAHGDLRSLTFGGSPGTVESGTPGVRFD